MLFIADIATVALSYVYYTTIYFVSNILRIFILNILFFVCHNVPNRFLDDAKQLNIKNFSSIKLKKLSGVPLLEIPTSLTKYSNK